MVDDECKSSSISFSRKTIHPVRNAQKDDTPLGVISEAPIGLINLALVMVFSFNALYNTTDLL